MADLKLNDDLYLNSSSMPPIESIAGNLKLVGYGVTDEFSAPKTTWKARGFNAATMSYDEEYLTRTAADTNSFTVVKAGMYFFFWQSRLKDSGASTGTGININGADRPTDERFAWGPGTVFRSYSAGVNGEQLAAGTTISTCFYSDAAQMIRPVIVWIFVVKE